jgi:NADPH-dependent curcumin reductase CurA
MSAELNRMWRVARHPSAAELIGAEHFEWSTEPVPEPADGEFLVRTEYLAPIPAQRGYLDERQAALLGKSLIVGAIMRGRGIGTVVKSRHPDYTEGEIFVGSLGWQDYSIQRPAGANFVFSTCKISNPRDPLSLHMGVLGQAGGTAYFGLTEAGGIKAGDNVLISAAAGGIGSTAGQIARIKGANKVVGIAGSAEKCAWLSDELGFTAAINYQTDNVDVQLARHFPDGFDLMLDGVGGELLNTALAHLAMHARVVISGYLATQYAGGKCAGPANYTNLLFKRASMRGYIYFDYWDRYAEAEQQLCEWFDAGRLIDTEYLTDGLENMPAALADLFTGGNRGIAICRVRSGC